jgi:hypothetical protein
MERARNQKQVVASLLEKANKYREFARWIGDRETVQQVLALAGELKQRASLLQSLTKTKSASAPAKSGKKTADRLEEMPSSGFRPNESLGKRKNSQ